MKGGRKEEGRREREEAADGPPCGFYLMISDGYSMIVDEVVSDKPSNPPKLPPLRTTTLGPVYRYTLVGEGGGTLHCSD